MKQKRLLIIGLDGATWNIITPLLNCGALPNFKKIIEQGVYGELESTFPPVTGPSWLSMATGKNPGKTGIFDFFSKDEKSLASNLINSADFRKNITYWDLLNENGFKIFLINHPMLYPFYDVDGVIVGGMGLPKNANITYPRTLEKKLNEITDGYWTGIEYTVENKNNLVKNLSKFIDKQFTVVNYLINENWNLFLHVSSAPDWLQHALWEDWENSKSIYHKDFIEIWKLIDKKLGMLLQNVNNTNVLIVSDHGFGSLKENFLLSKWLYNEGYLKKKHFAVIYHMIHSIIRLIFQKVKNTSFKKYIKINKIINKTLEQQFNIHTQIPPEVDISKSIVLPGPSSGSQGYLYIKKTVKNQDSLKQEIKDKLKKIAGEYKFQIKIYEPSDIYSGDKLYLAPDIMFCINNFQCNIQTSTLKGKLFSEKLPNNYHSGDHRMEGILIAFGPDMNQSEGLKKFKIYDIAPTILHMFDIPIPKDLDGKVLKEIFKADSEFAQKEIVYGNYNEEKNMIKERIKILKKSGKI
jgi:predicted AlkP superfamily phosphohydrolase/phosphomutase